VKYCSNAMRLIAFEQYFTASGRAFFFIPTADNQMLRAAMVAYGSLATSPLAILVIGQFAQAAFTATCVVYALRLVQERTGVFGKMFKMIQN
jgi:hypothetical protein